jgi:hypothetical protein
MENGLDSSDIQSFQTVCRRLANRYSTLENAAPGLLIFLNVRVTPSKGMGGTFFVLFACDFEQLSRFDPSLGQVEIVNDGVDRKCRKAFIFPFFDGYALSRDGIKIINSGKSGGTIPELLYVDPPKTTEQLLLAELYQAVSSRHDPGKYKTYFESHPDEREVFGDDSIVKAEDLLEEDEVKHISKMTYQSAVDHHGKKPRVRLIIDEGVKFEGRLDKLGESFFFARKGNNRFLIVRGQRFLTKSELSSIEFMEVSDLEEVIPRIAGGGDEE